MTDLRQLEEKVTNFIRNRWTEASTLLDALIVHRNNVGIAVTGVAVAACISFGLLPFLFYALITVCTLLPIKMWLFNKVTGQNKSSTPPPVQRPPKVRVVTNGSSYHNGDIERRYQELPEQSSQSQSADRRMNNNVDKESTPSTSNSSYVRREGSVELGTSLNDSTSLRSKPFSSLTPYEWSAVTSPGFSSRIVRTVEREGGRSYNLSPFQMSPNRNLGIGELPSTSSLWKASTPPSPARFSSPQSANRSISMGYHKREEDIGRLFLKIAPLADKPGLTPVPDTQSSLHPSSPGLGGIRSPSISNKMGRLWSTNTNNSGIDTPTSPVSSPSIPPFIAENLNRKRNRNSDQGADSTSILSPTTSLPSEEAKTSKRLRYLNTTGDESLSNSSLSSVPLTNYHHNSDMSSESILEQMNQTEKRFLPDDESTSRVRQPSIKRQRSISNSSAHSPSMTRSIPSPSTNTGHGFRKRKVVTTSPRTSFAILEEEDGRAKEKAPRLCGCADCYKEAAGIPLTVEQNHVTTPAKSAVITQTSQRTHVKVNQSDTKTSVQKSVDVTDRDLSSTREESNGSDGLFAFAVIDKEKHMADKKRKEARLRKILELKEENATSSSSQTVFSHNVQANLPTVAAFSTSTPTTTSLSFTSPSSSIIPTSAGTGNLAPPPTISSTDQFGSPANNDNANAVPNPTFIPTPSINNSTGGASVSAPPPFASTPIPNFTLPQSSGTTTSSPPSTVKQDTPVQPEQPKTSIPPFQFGPSQPSPNINLAIPTSSATNSSSTEGNLPNFAKATNNVQTTTSPIQFGLSNAVQNPVTTANNNMPVFGIGGTQPSASTGSTTSTFGSSGGFNIMAATTKPSPFGGVATPVTQSQAPVGFGLGVSQSQTTTAVSAPMNTPAPASVFGASATNVPAPSATPTPAFGFGVGFSNTTNPPASSSSPFKFGGIPSSPLNANTASTASGLTTTSLANSVSNMGDQPNFAKAINNTQTAPAPSPFQFGPSNTSQNPVSTVNSNLPVFGIGAQTAAAPTTNTTASTFGSSGGFSFGGATATPSPFGGISTSVTQSQAQAPIGFGGGSQTTTAAAPTSTPAFAFGATTTNVPVTSTAPPFGFGGGFPSTNLPASSSPFQFGATPSSSQNIGSTFPASTTSLTGSTSTVGDLSGFAKATNNTQTAPSPFQFGASNTFQTPGTTVNNTMPIFGVGGTQPSTGLSTNTTSSTFGSSGGFNFGAATATPSPFGISTPATQSQAPMGFGGSQTTNTMAPNPPGFAFGASATNVPAPSPTPPFGFGGGFPATNSPAPSTPFQFGAMPNSPPNTGFGGGGIQPQQSPMFTLGGSTTSSPTAARRTQIRGRRYR